MYFIIKTTLNEKQQPISLEIINHASKISAALKFLENNAKEYVKEECGKQAFNNAKIIDIHDLGQVNEPLVDSILIYRLDTDAHTLHIYRRKSTEVPAGWIYGKSSISDFRRILTFTLVEYTQLTDVKASSAPILPPVEMITIGPAQVQIPKIMTMSPICDVIEQLKKSEKFKKRFEASEVVDEVNQ